MNTLPRGADFDGRLQTVRRHVVKCNAVQDVDSYALARQRCRTRAEDVLYDGTQLTGMYSEDQYKIFELEPAGVLTQRAIVGDHQRFPAGNGQRGARGQETRVPIYSVANGLRGKTPAEIDEQITILGLTDQTGREVNKTYCNLIVGGMVTVCNSGPETIMTGDLVMARCPTVEEAKNIRARAGDIANTKGPKGRIPFILVPFRPERYDFYNYNARVMALNALYTVDDEGLVQKKADAANKADPLRSLDFLTQRFCYEYNELVDATTQLATSIAFYNKFLILRAGKSDATLMSAERSQKIIHTCAVASILASSRNGRPINKSDPGIERLLVNAPADFLDHGNRHNPFQQMTVATTRFGVKAASKVLGRAMISAGSGKDFDIFISSYCR